MRSLKRNKINGLSAPFLQSTHQNINKIQFSIIFTIIITLRRNLTILISCYGVHTEPPLLLLLRRCVNHDFAELHSLNSFRQRSNLLQYWLRFLQLSLHQRKRAKHEHFRAILSCTKCSLGGSQPPPPKWPSYADWHVQRFETLPYQWRQYDLRNYYVPSLWAHLCNSSSRALYIWTTCNVYGVTCRFCEEFWGL
jgi:hypothetical protein